MTTHLRMLEEHASNARHAFCATYTTLLLHPLLHYYSHYFITTHLWLLGVQRKQAVHLIFDSLRLYVCVREYLCVCERERERKQESVFVCVGGGARKRERERESKNA